MFEQEMINVYDLYTIDLNVDDFPVITPENSTKKITS